MPEIVVRHEDGVVEAELQQPVLSGAMLTALEHTLSAIAEQWPASPVVLCSRHPRIFLAGAHLAEIAALDPDTSHAYACRGRAVLHRVENLPAPVVAAVHGPCTGGGLDLVLCCDAVVAGPDASFSHPGVHRGLITGWGGTTLLPERLGAARARRHLLEGSALTTTAFGQLPTHPAARGEERARARLEARRLSSIHPARRVLWRSLKSGRFIDRFRIFMVHNVLREAGFERRGKQASTWPSVPLEACEFD